MTTKPIANEYDTDVVVNEESYATGFRRVNYYNADANWHGGTPIEQGGFGIEAHPGESVPPIGPITEIRHMMGHAEKKTQEACARQVEVAIIGASPIYTQYWPDGVQTRAPILLPPYFKPENDNGKARSGISLYIVFKCDPDRRIYEITFKVRLTDAATGILNSVAAASHRMAEAINKATGKSLRSWPRFMLWVTIKAGVTRKVGKEQQGNNTFPELVWPKAEMTGEDLYELCRVSREDYLKFVQMRRELDDLFASGFRQPIALNSPQRLQQLVAQYYRNAGEVDVSDGSAEDAPEEPDFGDRGVLAGAPAQIEPARAAKPALGDPSKLPNAKTQVFRLLATSPAAFDEQCRAFLHDPNLGYEYAMQELNYTVDSLPLDMTVEQFFTALVKLYK